MLKGLIIFISDYSENEQRKVLELLKQKESCITLYENPDFNDFNSVYSAVSDNETEKDIKNVVFLLNADAKKIFLNDIDSGRYKSKWFSFNRIHKDFMPFYKTTKLIKQSSNHEDKFFLDFKLTKDYISLLKDDEFSYDVSLTVEDLESLLINDFTLFQTLFRNYKIEGIFNYESYVESLLRAYNLKTIRKSFFSSYMRLRYCLIDMPRRGIMRKQFRDRLFKPLVFSYYTTNISKEDYKRKLIEFRDKVLFKSSKIEMSCIQDIINFVDEPEADELRNLVLNVDATKSTFSEKDLKDSKLLFFDVNYLIAYKNSKDNFLDLKVLKEVSTSTEVEQEFINIKL